MVNTDLNCFAMAIVSLQVDEDCNLCSDGVTWNLRRAENRRVSAGRLSLGSREFKGAIAVGNALAQDDEIAMQCREPSLRTICLPAAALE